MESACGSKYTDHHFHTLQRTLSDHYDRKKRLVTRNNSLIIVINLVATVAIVLDLLVKAVVKLQPAKSILKAIASSVVARL